jgi:2'-5' RNA ligase
VVHSIELLLDEPAEELIRQQWRALAEAGLPSEHRPGLSVPRRPHITLIACTRIEAEQADRAAHAVRPELPLPLGLGAPMIFGRGRSRRPDLILVRQVLASVALLQLQQRVAELCPPAVDQHFDAGRWAPHITLARRLAADQLGSALRAISGSGRETDAEVVGCRFWQGDLKQVRSLV